MKKIIALTFLCSFVQSVHGMQQNFSTTNLQEQYKNFNRLSRDEFDQVMGNSTVPTYIFTPSYHLPRVHMLSGITRTNNRMQFLSNLLNKKTDAKRRSTVLNFVKNKSDEMKKTFKDNAKVFLRQYPNLYRYPHSFMEQVALPASSGPLVGYGSILWGLLRGKDLSDKGSFVNKVFVSSIATSLAGVLISFIVGKRSANKIYQKDSKMFRQTKKEASLINQQACVELTKIDCANNYQAKLNDKRNSRVYCDIKIKTNRY